MAVKNLKAGYMSFAKYDRPQPVVDVQAWHMACDWVRFHFSPFVRGSKCLSEQEAISELDKTTSCGFPWSLKYHSKREFLESDSCGVISWYWDHLGEEDYHPIWSCTQKVELRPNEKLDANKLRTFTSSPIEHSVAATRLCYDFNNRFYGASDTWSFVGRTKYMQGWDKLVNRLSKHQKGLAFDASSWDASCFRLAMADQMEFRWESLEMTERTRENRVRMEVIYREIIDSVTVLETGELVCKNTGNPSGSVNTIVDNTMILYRCIAYCWIRSSPPELKTYLSFTSLVEAALNGDDNDLAVAPIARLFFNTASIVKHSAELGVVMTTPHEEYRDIVDLEFLSHTTVRAFGMYLPAPDTEKVLCSLSMGSSTDDVRWHLLRASALLIESWANVQCRAILRDYIDYLCVRYQDELAGEVNGYSITSIFANIKTDRWILQLYTGREGLLGSRGNCHIPIKLLDMGHHQVPNTRHHHHSKDPLVQFDPVTAQSAVTRPSGPDDPQYNGYTPNAAREFIRSGKRMSNSDPDSASLPWRWAQGGALHATEVFPGWAGNYESVPATGVGPTRLYHPRVRYHPLKVTRTKVTDKTIPVFVDGHAAVEHVKSKSKEIDILTQHKRKRTKIPYVDGLVNVEANPGMGKTKKAIKKAAKAIRGFKRTHPPPGNYLGGQGNMNQSRSGNSNMLKMIGQTRSDAGIRRVREPYVTGSIGSGNTFRGSGTTMVLGSQAHIFSGRCAVQNLATNAGPTFVFSDANANLSSFMYMNPRICCQNATYNVPLGNCPIGVIAQAFRKYSFRRLVLCYEPTTTNTNLSGVVAVMYDPEVIATSSLGGTTMAFANYECSKYGPMWAPWKLDITPFLDRSKWFYSETPTTIATSLIASQSIQGTVQLCSASGPAVATLYGMFWLDFELALSELGPTEVFTAPALKEASVVAHDKNLEEKKEEKHVVVEPDSPELVENPMTRSLHLSQSSVTRILNAIRPVSTG